LRVSGRDEAHLDHILAVIGQQGAEPVDASDVRTVRVAADGVFPDDFYATTNLETAVRIGGRWVSVDRPEMDLGIVIEEGSARTVAMADARAGQEIVVGHFGVRVKPLERPRDKQEFEFMNSEVSSEKPKALVIKDVARMLEKVRGRGQSIIFVVGPAVVHTGAAEHLARLVRAGYVQVLFGGNAVAVHDIESALYGTSLGVSMEAGMPTVGGHEHHLRAINTIRGCGGIAPAVERGVLSRGLMHTLVTEGVPYVLAGSIRDDGPLPDVITDVMAAQQAMRELIPGVGMAIMVGSTLHAVATGNLLPARVFTVCVDINPGVVTKLQDRGSRQSVGIVMDAASFLEQLADGLSSGNTFIATDAQLSPLTKV